MLAFTVFHIIFPLKNRYEPYERIIKSTTLCVAVMHLGVKPNLFRQRSRHRGTQGVTLAQLVKASVGQSDVRRFEPHLGHNLLSCGVFLVKSRHFGLPLAQTIMAKLAISLSGWLGRYTNVEYLQSLYLKRRGQLLFQV